MINVLTRTHGRPKSFARCRESVLAQTVPARHIVYADDAEYAEGDVVIDHEPVPFNGFREDAPASYRGHRKLPYDLYINILMDVVDDGWILILDDDDELTDERALERVLPHLGNEDRLVVAKFMMRWRTDHQVTILPRRFGRPLELNDTTSGGYLFHAKHKESAYWLDCSGSDFYCADKLQKKLGIVWADEIIARGTEHLGRPIDEKRPWKPWDGGLLSIIIPVHNLRKYTEAILENIAETTHADHEIIIVDNGSTDGTADMAWKRQVHVIRNEENLGIGRAWNQGARVAHGDHLAFLNNDLVLPDGWAEKLIAHDEHAICPQYTYDDSGDKIPPESHGMREAARPGQHPDGFAGFCFILSREAWGLTGEFDERFRYWHTDNDYWRRLRCESTMKA